MNVDEEGKEREEDFTAPSGWWEVLVGGNLPSADPQLDVSLVSTLI